MTKNELQKAIIEALAAAPLIALEQLKQQLTGEDAGTVQPRAESIRTPRKNEH